MHKEIQQNTNFFRYTLLDVFLKNFLSSVCMLKIISIKKKKTFLGTKFFFFKEKEKKF